MPTALRFLEMEGRAPAPHGSSIAGAARRPGPRTPPSSISTRANAASISARRHVRDAPLSARDTRPFARDAVLESAIYELDAEQGGPWDGKSLYWEAARGLDKWTSGCCRLPSVEPDGLRLRPARPPRDAAASRVMPRGPTFPSTVVG